MKRSKTPIALQCSNRADAKCHAHVRSAFVNCNCGFHRVGKHSSAERHILKVGDSMRKLIAVLTLRKVQYLDFYEWISLKHTVSCSLCSKKEI